MIAKRIVATEAPWVRWSLTGIALAFLLLFLALPLAAVFTEALRKGWGAYLEALREPDDRLPYPLEWLEDAIRRGWEQANPPVA